MKDSKRQQQLGRLAKALAILYETEGKIRRVASNAGLNVASIEFAGGLGVACFNTVSQAEKEQRVPELVAVARDEFRREPELNRSVADLVGSRFEEFAEAARQADGEQRQLAFETLVGELATILADIESVGRVAGGAELEPPRTQGADSAWRDLLQRAERGKRTNALAAAAWNELASLRPAPGPPRVPQALTPRPAPTGLLGRAGALADRLLYPRKYREWFVPPNALVPLQNAKYQPTVAQVYVNLSVERPKGKTATNPVPTDAQPRQPQSIWSIVDDVGLTPGVPVVILGPPGYGKSTLLQHVGLVAIKRPWWGSRRWMPILLRLREEEVMKAILAAGSSLPEVMDRLAGSSIGSAGEHVRRRLSAGDAIVLIDGLDEVIDRDRRREVVRWIDRESWKWQRNPFVVTSRPMAYEATPLPRAATYAVIPFSPEQIEQFITQWAEGYWHANPREAEAMKRSLQDLIASPSNDWLRQFARSPMLLTFLCLAYEPAQPFPETKAGLYARIIDREIQKYEGLSGAPVAPAMLRDALRHVALAMTEQSLLEIDGDAVITALSPVAGSAGRARSILNFHKDRTGLFWEQARGRWAFAHRSFQEYLAAEALLQRREPDALEGHLSQEASIESWREVLHWYALLGAADEVVQACLRVDTTEALALAASCLEDVPAGLSEDTRARAHERFEAALDTPDDPSWADAAKVWLTRRLRSMVPLDPHGEGPSTEVSPTFVSGVEMRLYAMETGARREQVPSANEREPARALDVAEMEGFCAWLTKRDRQGWRYRPLRQDEAEALPRGGAGIGTWCSGPEGVTLAGLSPDEEKRTEDLLRQVGAPYGVTLRRKLRDIDWREGRQRAFATGLAQWEDPASTRDRMSAFATKLAPLIPLDEQYRFEGSMEFGARLSKLLTDGSEWWDLDRGGAEWRISRHHADRAAANLDALRAVTSQLSSGKSSRHRRGNPGIGDEGDFYPLTEEERAELERKRANLEHERWVFAALEDPLRDPAAAAVFARDWMGAHARLQTRSKGPLARLVISALEVLLNPDEPSRFREFAVRYVGYAGLLVRQDASVLTTLSVWLLVHQEAGDALAAWLVVRLAATRPDLPHWEGWRIARERGA